MNTQINTFTPRRPRLSLDWTGKGRRAPETGRRAATAPPAPLSTRELRRIVSEIIG
ncbi:MAG: hypothetical protein H7X93_06660 [Sphingomonadaceae bacterium]|nr:hypothetical protein [Sphingomonadaceae bacterium]